MYLNAGITPKGMSLSLPPACTNLDQHDRSEWQQVLLEGSLKLVQIAIQHSDKQVKQLTTATATLLRSNGPLSTSEISALSEFDKKKHHDLATIKLRKLQRDKVPNPVLPQLTTSFNYNEHTQPAISITDDRSSTSAPCGTTIVNLSGVTISTEEERLLSRGLNFCPATGFVDEFQLLRDLDNFARNLRLREYFLDNTSSSNTSQQRATSDWTPKANRDDCLDLYIAAVQKDIMREYRRQAGRRDNLTKSERASLKTLSNRTDITIKPADKGGAIVILSTSEYIREGNRQLNDSKFYEPLADDPTVHHTQIVTSVLKDLLDEGRITANEHKLMKPVQPSPGRFYMLPKIHKPGNPGRPIISGIGTVTEPISGYVDSLIKHIPTILDSYIKDTTHFLREISNLCIPKESYLVTLDVSSLYTNIPHDDGILSLIDMYELHKQPDTPDGHVVATLARLVLELNTFEFNNKYFRQVSGTAMGTKMAPNYANIFMGKLESQFLSECPVKPLIYKRFIDDIFIVWSHTEEELVDFIGRYNAAHPSIRFTHSYSQTEINFLDVNVKIDESKLATSLYRKPTDRQQYLHYQSDHPHHCKNSIPYSQAHRFKRICSKETDFDASSQNLKSVLEKQKYPPRIIDDAIRKAKQLNRADLISPRPTQSDTQRTNLCLTYSINHPNVNNVLRRHYNILEQSERLKRAFPSAPGVVHRRSRNLKDALVNSRINSSPPPNECRPCRHPGCLICKQMQHTSTASSTHSQFSIKIKGNLTCASSNVIYLFECTVCKMQYIGQTRTAFRLRFNNHKSHAINLPALPLSKHLALPKHSFDKLSVTLLESGFKSNREREQRESYLIYRFNTIKQGINESPGTLASIKMLTDE